jgi:hypothetical protein
VRYRASSIVSWLHLLSKAGYPPTISRLPRITMQTRSKQQRLVSQAAAARVSAGVVPCSWQSVDEGVFGHILEQVRRLLQLIIASWGCADAWAGIKDTATHSKAHLSSAFERQVHGRPQICRKQQQPSQPASDGPASAALWPPKLPPPPQSPPPSPPSIMAPTPTPLFTHPRPPRRPLPRRRQARLPRREVVRLGGVCQSWRRAVWSATTSLTVVARMDGLNLPG